MSFARHDNTVTIAVNATNVTSLIYPASTFGLLSGLHLSVSGTLPAGADVQLSLTDAAAAITYFHCAVTNRSAAVVNLMNQLICDIDFNPDVMPEITNGLQYSVFNTVGAIGGTFFVFWNTYWRATQ